MRLYQVRPGDLLLAEGGDIGRAEFVPETLPERFIIQNSLHRVRVRSGDIRFVRYALNTAKSSGWLEVVCNRSTFGHLTVEKLASLRLPWPVSSAQPRIADFLDTETARIDALIAKKRQLQHNLFQWQEAQIAAWAMELVASAGTAPLRRWIGRLEQGWSPVCDSVPAEVREWGVLKTSSVSSGSFLAAENKRLPEGVRPDLRWAVRDGDLLMVRGSGSPGSVGMAAVVDARDRHLTISDLLYRIRLEGMHSGFAAAVLRSRPLRQQIEGSIRSDTGQTLKLRADDIKDLQVPAVDVANQSPALELLEAELKRSSALAAPLDRQITLLQERRQALITAAVTGELEASGAP